MEKVIEIERLEYSTESQTLKLDPLGDGISSVELVRVSGSDLDVVNAARVSYGKVSNEITERDKKLINYLIKHDHTSPFEHNQLSFRIKCPLFVARQWMRHRMNSYNEISYRYVESPLEFYIPVKWRYQDETNRQCSTGEFEDDIALIEYKKALATSGDVYLKLLENGVAREIARGVLPMCTYTEYVFTCNLHSLFNFLKLRLGPGAQWEIRKYAECLFKLAQPHFPASFEGWQKKNAEFEFLKNI